MVSKVDVFYEGWGERWLWGTLVSSTALTGRPLIVFEFSQQAIDKGLELSKIELPLQGSRLRRGFPAHQLGLPGPVYDALPDGWGRRWISAESNWLRWVSRRLNLPLLISTELSTGYATPQPALPAWPGIRSRTRSRPLRC